MSKQGYRIRGIVPAAGRGSRLGGTTPKALVQISPELRVIDVVIHALESVCDQVCLVVATDFESNEHDPVLFSAVRCERIVQSNPTGMLDAIELGCDSVSQSDVILVIWGDQVGVRAETLKRAVELHTNRDRTIVIPTVEVTNPYVQYVFAAGQLHEVRESREGHSCDPVGLADVGVFVMSRRGLTEAFASYRSTAQASSITGEVNFLPFLVWASSHSWTVTSFMTTHQNETLGINTQEDLIKARALLVRSNHK